MVLILTFLLFQAVNIKAQGYGDRTGGGGTGGRNSLQGRIYLPSNRPAATLKIRLENTLSATLTTYSNSEGVFNFNNLDYGQYTIIIETGNEYEPVRESLLIEREAVPGVMRTINLVFELRPKFTSKSKTGVIDASLVNIPKPALEAFRKALEELEKNETTAAIEKLNEATKEYPQFADAYSVLGSLYLKSGELNKAEETLRRTLQLNTNNPTAQLNYGITLLNQRKMFEAEKELEKAVLADKQSATPHLYLGIALLGLNYPDYAEKEFLTAISLGDDEKLAQAHRYLGGIYWQKENFKQAVDELEKYLKLAPKASDAEKVKATIKQLRAKIK